MQLHGPSQLMGVQRAVDNPPPSLAVVTWVSGFGLWNCEHGMESPPHVPSAAVSRGEEGVGDRCSMCLHCWTGCSRCVCVSLSRTDISCYFSTSSGGGTRL